MAKYASQLIKLDRFVPHMLMNEMKKVGDSSEV